MRDTKFTDDLLAAQKNEMTEYLIYSRLARKIKDSHHGDALKAIADEEVRVRVDLLHFLHRGQTR